MPDFRSNKAIDTVQGAKTRLAEGEEPRGDDARGAPLNVERHENRLYTRGQRKRLKKLKRNLRMKKQEIRRINQEIRTTAEGQFTGQRSKELTKDQRRRKKSILQEIFELQRQLRLAEGEDPGTGALPDFVIIGEKKCGTTSLYHLLSQHPLVEPAASKELHFFDNNFDLGVEWYRQCFPAPRWEGGKRTITGEASPYMAHNHTPERMAGVIPQARLIVLLRNPVERAYSDYQMGVRKGRETRSFEEAIGAAQKALFAAQQRKALADIAASGHGLLTRGIYVVRLLRWAEFFPREQMLVLKSEEFFENPNKTLKTALDFLDLPEWEPEATKLDKVRNAGSYEEEIEPATRRRLEEFFEPHNKRLYEFLGEDLGW